MPENLRAFIDRVSSLRTKAYNYRENYDYIGSVLGDNLEVSGLVDIQKTDPRLGTIKDLVVELSRYPTEGYRVAAKIDLGEGDLRQVFERILPNPDRISVEDLEAVSSDEIFHALVYQLEFDNVREGFKPKNDPTP